MKELVTLLITTTLLFANYPESIQVPVTFFDFHSDGSNPDFNPGVAIDTVTLGMVEKKLSRNQLPKSTDKSLYSYDISRWFKPWKPYAEKPQYAWWDGSVDNMETLTGSALQNDTTYINKQIDTTLTFMHQGNGIYNFESSDFFPLDGKGFGSEKTKNWDGKSYKYDHNYSFSMMLEREFVYSKGLRFEFSGDDDVWVFINDELALDLGGCHPEKSGSFDLDNVAETMNLTLGKSYKIRFFFAERQADGSNCKISSNIISAPPNNLNIKVEPDNSVKAGDTLDLTALIDSDTGLVTDIAGSITWTITDANKKNGSDAVTKIDDLAAIVHPHKAHTTLTITATYKDPKEGHTFTDQTEIKVLPGAPHHLSIEATPEKPEAGEEALWNNTPMTQTHILPEEQYREDFYALYRDTWNNWIGPAGDLQWDSWNIADNLLATASQGSNPSQGQGKVERNESIFGGATLLWASIDSMSDTIAVLIDPMYRLECQALPSPFHPDSTIDFPAITEIIPDLEEPKGMIFTMQFKGIVNEYVQPKKMRIVILDMTGNTVRSISLRDDEIPYQFPFSGRTKENNIAAVALLHWDGTNNAGRPVGAGTYFCLFEFEDNGGSVFSEKIHVGVKR